jgi:hypothetical protein
MIVYGGLLDRDGTSSQQPADGNSVWFLDLNDPTDLTWSREHVNGNPTERFAHAAVYVPGYDALVVSGGAGTFEQSTTSNYALYLGEEPMRWERLANAGFTARAGHALIYDEAASRLVVYGGIDNFSNRDGIREVIQLDVSGGLAAEKRWSRVTTATPGIARGLMATAFDPVTRMLWVQGGVESANRFSRDLSVLDLGQAPPVWTRTQEVINGPLERFAHTAALDTARNRVVFQGGTPDNAITLRDTRAINVGSPPVPTTTPEPTDTPATATTTATATSSPTPTATQDSPATATPTPTATSGSARWPVYLPYAANAHTM